MAYKRQDAPKEYDPYWLTQELEKLEQQLLGTDVFRLKELHVAPSKPRLGDIVLADGVDWDPGAGQGVYVFDGSNFVLLGFDTVIGTGDIADNAITQAKMADNSVGTAEIIDSNVTLAKLANIAATRVIGSVAGGTPAELTLSQVLDFIGSAAQGDILYRGNSAWARLAAGTSGQFLRTLGSGNNPAWADELPTLIAQGDISAGASSVDIPLGSYERVDVSILIEPANDGVSLLARLEQGGSYLSGAADYAWGLVNDGTGANDNSDSEIQLTGSVGNATGEFVHVKATIIKPAGSGNIKSLIWYGGYVTDAGNHIGNHGMGRLLANTDAVTGLRFLMSAGNIDAGYYAAVGYNLA